MSQAGIINAAGSNPAIPTSFVTDSGTAVPAANILHVNGGTNCTTSGAGSTITITVTGSGTGTVKSVTGNSGGAVGPDGSGNINVLGSGNINVAGNAGTNTETITLTGTTNHAVQIGNSSGSLTSVGVGNNGQLLIGSTGADPAFASLTSSGSTLSYTAGANSLNIDINAPVTVPNGGTGRTTLTNHGVLVGAATSAITQLAAGSAGQVLQSGGAGADPAYSSSTYPLTNNTGDLIYGSGSNSYSNLAIATLPGQPLNYNGTNVNWFNPLQESYIFDDFISAQVNGNGGVGNANIFKATTTGTGANVTAGGSSTHPGYIILRTGTTNTGFGSINAVNSATTNPIIIGGGAFSVIYVVQLPVLSNGTDTYFFMCGLWASSVAATPSNGGIYFSYNDNGGGGTKPNWFINGATGSTVTSTSSGVAAGTGFTTLRFDVNAAGTSVAFSINGSSVGTVSTNLPSTNIGPTAFILKQAGTTDTVANIDLFYFYQKLTSSR